MIRPHPFSPDTSATDRPGKVVACVLCDLPPKNKIHYARPVGDDTERIVGDKEGGSDG